jgi:very-long-chain (3R)-3-hydroxyacyl-CoA dehydratase
MARPNTSSKPVGGATAAESPLKTGYLVLYNATSALLWTTVLTRTITLAAARGPGAVHAGVGDWTKWTQTLALLEVAHALLGVVRAPLATTVMQISSRLLLVWAIVHPFPHLARENAAYTTMLLAWSATEVIRYTFFTLTKAVGAAPDPLVWLRYSSFLVLYPVGITSECLMIWAAVPEARKLRQEYAWGLYAILAIYVPGKWTNETRSCPQGTAAIQLANMIRHRIIHPLHVHDEPEEKGAADAEDDLQKGAMRCS